MILSQNYHQTLSYPCFNLKVGITWPFSQNYHQTPWYPCFILKVGIIRPLSKNYHPIPWYPHFKLKVGIIWSFPRNFHQTLGPINFFNFDRKDLVAPKVTKGKNTFTRKANILPLINILLISPIFGSKSCRKFPLED